MQFLERKLLYFYSNLTEGSFQGSRENKLALVKVMARQYELVTEPEEVLKNLHCDQISKLIMPQSKSMPKVQRG